MNLHKHRRLPPACQILCRVSYLSLPRYTSGEVGHLSMPHLKPGVAILRAPPTQLACLLGLVQCICRSRPHPIVGLLKGQHLWVVQDPNLMVRPGCNRHLYRCLHTIVTISPIHRERLSRQTCWKQPVARSSWPLCNRLYPIFDHSSGELLTILRLN